MAKTSFVLLIPNLTEFGIGGKTLGEDVWGKLSSMAKDFELVRAIPTRFDDTSFKIELDKSVRGKEVYIFMSPYLVSMGGQRDKGSDKGFDASGQIMLTTQMIEASRRARAGNIHLMETYNPWYAQDRRDTEHRESISGKVVADMYKSSGLFHCFCFEPHSSPSESWYERFDPIYMASFLAREVAGEFGKSLLKNSGVGIPDQGSMKRSKHFAKALFPDFSENEPEKYLVEIGKLREHESPKEAKALPIQRNLEGKTIFLYDDMIRGGETAIRASEAAKHAGAEKVIVVVTHLGLYEPDKVFDCNGIDYVRGTNTIPGRCEHNKLRIYDISHLAANIINKDSHGEDVSGYLKSLAPSMQNE